MLLINQLIIWTDSNAPARGSRDLAAKGYYYLFIIVTIYLCIIIIIIIVIDDYYHYT